MGFSITQARTALAATDTGTDVQAALEILFANGAAGGSESRPRSREDHEDAPPPRLPRRRPDAPPRRDSSPSRRGDGILGDQASVYIAQASEVGSTLLKNASAFWKQGKQNLQKAYDARQLTDELMWFFTLMFAPPIPILLTVPMVAIFNASVNRRSYFSPDPCML